MASTRARRRRSQLVGRDGHQGERPTRRPGEADRFDHPPPPSRKKNRGVGAGDEVGASRSPWTKGDTMTIAIRHAELVWDGTLATGEGALSSGSGAFELPVTWASRTERPDGKTSPEELVAAAHASC